MRLHPAPLLIFLGVVAMAGPGSASGLSIAANLSQGFTAINNFGDTDDDRFAFRTTTDLGLNFRGQYPATAFALSIGARLTGDTGEEGAFFSTPNPRIIGRVTRNGPRLSTFASVSVIPEFTSENQFDFVDRVDTGTGEVIGVDRRVRDEDVLQLRMDASAGASLQLDPANSVSLTTFASAREYPDGSESLDPTRSVGATLGWTRALDRLTTAGLSLSTRLFTSERDDTDDELSTTLSTNVSRSFTPRHRGSASVGVNVVDAEELEPNLVGSLSFFYSPTADITMRAGAGQDVAQNDSGEVRLVTRLSGSTTWSVNSVSSFNIGTGINFDTPVSGDDGDDLVTLRVTAGYSLRITERWSFGVSYGVVLETEQSDLAGRGSDGSHNIFMRLSRDFDILP